MNGKDALALLRRLCRELDSGGRGLALGACTVASATAPLILALAAGCHPAPEVRTLYGAPAPLEVCDNGQDDDGDGLSDCADHECLDFEACLPQDSPEYAAPFPEEQTPEVPPPVPLYGVETGEK